MTYEIFRSFEDSPVGEIPKVWQLLKLGDLGKIVTGKTPSTKVPEYFGGSEPFITPSDMDGRKTISRTVRYLTEEGVNAVKSAFIPAGTIIVSCIGSDMGKVACAIRNSVTNQQINSIIVSVRYSKEYVYYNLSSRKEELQNLAGGGSAVPILNKGDFSQLEILLPHSLSEQREIAHILSTLDDKIELNQQMNRNLEALAQAIFKSWFVDFDPVRAKMEGCQPVGMDAETATLFPNAFEDSPLGKIPKGWKVVLLPEVAAVLDCLHTKKPSDIGQGKLLLQVWNIADAGKLDLSKQYFVSDEDYKLWTSRIEVHEGDCVITNVGRVGAVAQIPHKVRAAIGRNMTAIRCRPGYLTPTYLVEYLLSSAMREEIELKTDSGTILDSLNVRGIEQLRLVIPPTRIMNAFEEKARPLRHHIELNIQEGELLATIRDALLPKLMSGEIRVKEAEQLLAAAA